MKIIKAVRPFFNNDSDFKIPPYEEWVKSGGRSVPLRKFEKYYRSLSFYINLPIFHTNKHEARLRFVEGATLQFDTFPDYLLYEVIPIIWDCWPIYFDKVAKFFKKHNVRTAFFTSSQTASRMKEVYPKKNIFHLPEAINTCLYNKGKPLVERNIDYLEYGRCSKVLDSTTLGEEIKVLSSRTNYGALIGIKRLTDALANSKITLAMTRQDNQPELAQGIDTLTQRYWECMLSGVVLLGRSPQELIDIVGYDPVVKLDMGHAKEQIQDMLNHISDYQELVNKNRESALQYGDWSVRIKKMREHLLNCGYRM